VDLLLDLEGQHEELFRRLEELDKRVEKTLAECQIYRTGAVPTPQAVQ
jgi:hypothetical protein